MDNLHPYCINLLETSSSASFNLLKELQAKGGHIMDLLAGARDLDLVRDFPLSHVGRKVLADEVQKLQQVRFWLADYQEYLNYRVQSF